MVKSVFTSKTNWLGVVMIVVSVLEFLGASPLLKEYSQWILLGSGVATIILRQLTSLPTSLTMRPKTKDIMR